MIAAEGRFLWETGGKKMPLGSHPERLMKPSTLIARRLSTADNLLFTLKTHTHSAVFRE